MLQAYFLKRDFSGGIELPGLSVTVELMRWAAIGGPDEARLIVRGNPDALWELVELLRCPVVIYDERSEPVWWGYVEAATVQKGKLSMGVSLAEMANRVQVVYSNLIAGLPLVGGRLETAAADDADSQAAYGVKAVRVPAGGMNASQANALRDSTLQARRWPVPVVTLEDRPDDVGMLELKGWWHTLDWSYFAQGDGRELSEVGGQQDWVGAQAADTKYAQSFQLGTVTGWDADRIWIKAKTIGAPADNLVVDICADNALSPGLVLASGTLPGPTMGVSTSMRLYELILSARVSMLNSTWYWIVCRRSGAIDGMNYYMVDTDQSGGGAYSRGALYVWNGAAWVLHNPGADLWFRLSGDQETTAQLREMLVTNPFFSGLDIEVDSGVWASQYRLGDHHTRTEIEELLRAGAASGRRLLARVEPNLRVRIYEEPAPGASDWGLFARGEIRDAGDQIVNPARGPVGVWARLRDGVPGSADVSKLADVSRVFIERAEWYRGRLRIEQK